jgi:hypothetical protein
MDLTNEEDDDKETQQVVEEMYSNDYIATGV